MRRPNHFFIWRGVRVGSWVGRTLVDGSLAGTGAGTHGVGEKIISLTLSKLRFFGTS
jgi:hypothetical protein